MTNGTTTTTISRLDPEIEAYKVGLLEDAQALVRDQIASGVLPAGFKVSDLSGLETQGADLAGGLGGYEQYITGALGNVQAGQRALGEAALPIMREGLDAYRSALGAVPTTAAQFDPTMAQAYMDPYEDQVVQQALTDLQRQSDIAQVGDQARAVGAGAFGGSREGVLRAENTRNLQEAQVRAAGQLRSAGYQQSLQNAQQAFEAARQRQLAGAGLTGQLASGIESLGGRTANIGLGLGTLGLQEAGLGELAHNLDLSRIGALMNVGGVQRAHQDRQLEALRQTNEATRLQPYQQLGFLSDIYSGVGSGSSSITAGRGSSPGGFQSALGTGASLLATGAAANRLF
jgi:hypothetical protein